MNSRTAPVASPKPDPVIASDLVIAAAKRLSAHLLGPRPSVVPDWQEWPIPGALFSDVVPAWDIEAARKLRTPVAALGLIEERTDEFYRRSNREPWRLGKDGAVQRLEATLGVLIVVSAKNDPGGVGTKKAARLEPLRDAVRRVLLGWTPDVAPETQPEPLMLMQGRLVGLQDGRLWWQEDYVTSHWVIGGNGLECGDGPPGADIRAGIAPRIGPDHEKDYAKFGGDR